MFRASLQSLFTTKPYILIALGLLLNVILFVPSNRGASTATLLANGSPSITNFADGDAIAYDLPLLKGNALNAAFVTVTLGSQTYMFSVHSGRWRGYIPLAVGSNTLTVSDSNGNSNSLNLTYVPSINPKKVRLVYMLGADSDGSFDAPVGVSNSTPDAVRRMQIAGRLMQSFSAELLYEKGLPRDTFTLVKDSNGEPVVDVERSSLTKSQIRSMDGGDLWATFYGELSNYPNRQDVIDIVIIADTHYDVATGTVQGHTALGGGRLGLFGSGTLHTFPENINEIEQHFLDSREIEPYLFPEYARTNEYWSIFTTSVGAMLHETGHCFGLPHPDPVVYNAIMWRGFDFLNRLSTTTEPNFGDIDPDTAMMPIWTDTSASLLLSNQWFDTFVTPTPTGTAVVSTSTPTPTGTAVVSTSTPTPTGTIKQLYLPIVTDRVASPTQTPPTPKNQLAFVSDRSGNREIYLLDVVSGDTLRLTHNDATDECLSWAPDGQRIAFTSGRDGYNQIYVMNADGSNQHRLLASNAWDNCPQWSPDGSKIAFFRDANHDGSGIRAETFVMNADGTNVTRLTYGSANQFAWASGWTADSTKIIFTWYRDGHNQMWIMNDDGTNQHKLSTDNHWNSVSMISPNGTQILFTSFRDGNQEVYVMNADGTNQTRLTFDPAEDWRPVWSEDGTKIIFEANRDGQTEVYWMNADGSNQQNLTSHSSYDGSAAWRP